MTFLPRIDKMRVICSRKAMDTMAKQLYFIHTEADIAPLVQYIGQLQGRFLVNSVFHSPLEMQQQVICAMAERPGHYEIVYVSSDSAAKWDAYACAGDGTAIQFVNCRKWSDDTHTYWDIGRIYLAPTKHGSFDPNTLALYKKLHGYFKKHYCFCKKAGVYLSPSFKEQYLLGKLEASQLGQPYPVRLFDETK